MSIRRTTVSDCDLSAAVAERLGDEVRRVGESVELNECDAR